VASTYQVVLDVVPPDKQKGARVLFVCLFYDQAVFGFCTAD